MHRMCTHKRSPVMRLRCFRTIHGRGSAASPNTYHDLWSRLCRESWTRTLNFPAGGILGLTAIVGLWLSTGVGVEPLSCLDFWDRGHICARGGQVQKVGAATPNDILMPPKWYRQHPSHNALLHGLTPTQCNSRNPGPSHEGRRTADLWNVVTESDLRVVAHVHTVHCTPCALHSGRPPPLVAAGTSAGARRSAKATP